MNDFFIMIFISLVFVGILGIIFLVGHAYPQDHVIDMEAIKSMESSGNPLAFNRGSQARGLYQITPIVLKEWNLYNADEKYSAEDLFRPEVNEKIAFWYMHGRIKHYLEYYQIDPTVENYLIAYHDGIGNLRRYLAGKRNLGQEMKGYLVKYAKATM